VVIIKNKWNLKIYFKNYDSGSISQELVEFIVAPKLEKSIGFKTWCLYKIDARGK